MHWYSMQSILFRQPETIILNEKSYKFNETSIIILHMNIIQRFVVSNYIIQCALLVNFNLTNSSYC